MDILTQRAERYPNLSSMEPELADRIIVARDLSPADAVMLRHRSMAAFVTSLGGPISHTAILARGLGIPAIVGLHGVIDTIRDQDTLIVDAASGTVLVSPDERLLKQFELLQARQHEERQALAKVGEKLSLIHI